MGFLFFLHISNSHRLALVKEEKEAMAKMLERLQLSGSSSTPGREDCRVRDVVRTLEEQLVKERAKSQRSASKRCQEQRLLLEQVKFCFLESWREKKKLILCYSAGFLTLSLWPAGGAESIRVRSPPSCQESHQ